MLNAAKNRGKGEFNQRSRIGVFKELDGIHLENEDHIDRVSRVHSDVTGCAGQALLREPEQY
jgi:hypothetical protein